MGRGSAEGAAREAQWRRRCKAVIEVAREIQFAPTAAQIRLAAIMSVLTEAELADINARIRAHRAKRPRPAAAGTHAAGTREEG